MLDPVAKNIQAYYPQPNLPGNVVNGVTTNNYTYQSPSELARSGSTSAVSMPT